MALFVRRQRCINFHYIIWLLSYINLNYIWLWRVSWCYTRVWQPEFLAQNIRRGYGRCVRIARGDGPLSILVGIDIYFRLIHLCNDNDILSILQWMNFPIRIRRMSFFISVTETLLHKFVIDKNHNTKYIAPVALSSYQTSQRISHIKLI